MDLVHNVRITVFAKQYEDADKIKHGLIQLAGLDIKEEKAIMTETAASGFNESKIKVLELSLEKKRHARSFLKHLTGILSQDQKHMLIRQAETRLDEELHFFIRLDKERWLNGEAAITESGNCYHIRMLIASYPKSRENALKAIDEIFS